MKKNISINPLEKIDEIISLFKDYNHKIFSNLDKGYEWIMEDDSKCIVFFNPYSDNNLTINVGDMGEFTLYFNNLHTHYLPYQTEYEYLIDTIKNILENNACCGYIEDKNGEWYGSKIFEKHEIDSNYNESFDFIFNHKEFYNKLNKNGYVVNFIFWNPIYNLKIEK